MIDIVNPATRSRMMSGIRSENTKIEIIVRKKLFARGFRYRIHDKKITGKPDIVLPRYQAVIFTHGCFWHGHSCKLFRYPATNTEFWRRKIKGNITRDRKNMRQLVETGWRIAVIHECAIRGKDNMAIEEVISTIEHWLKSRENFLEIPS